MTKQKILIFSDCYIYGGSEKLMAFLLKNEILNKSFTLLYGYRKHFEYERGLVNEELLERQNNYPLFLLSNETLFHQINTIKTVSFIKKLIKVPFFLLEKIKIYFLWNLLVFIFFLRKTKPNLIHINNGGYPGAKSCNILVVANYLTIKVKIIYQVNNQASESRSDFERMYDRFIDKNVNCFINASHKAKQRLVENRKFDSDKILVVNNCVPLPELKFNREQICAELNIPLTSFLIIEVAFLSERKGQRYLIDALSNLYKKELLTKEKVFCAFIGNGEDEEFLKKHIDQLGLNSNIFLLGYRNNSEDFIAASDLFVLPSIRDEDMPLVLLSALGYGKSIIATNFAGISQVIESNWNGVLIENDLETLTDNLSNEICRLYNDEALRTEFGINAQKTYVNYSPEVYGQKLKGIYKLIYAS
jgi:glycosyltransferase involved in cell wall biosynthesis